MSLFDFFRRRFPRDTSNTTVQGESGISVQRPDGTQSGSIFQDQEQIRFDENLRIVNEENAVERSQKTADKEVRAAAEQSLKRLHVLQRGRCPICGDALRQYLFVSVCDSCGWSSWSMPRSGGVKVHLQKGGEPITGDAAYVIKDGVTIVRRGEIVFARLPRDTVLWIEYVWTDAELRERERGLRERLNIACGWCGHEVDPEKEGFHLVHAAFGTTQERYCLCSDDCYEAFRKMYPPRIHRNCYDRDCEDCDLCLKRYQNDSNGVRSLPKDFLKVK